MLSDFEISIVFMVAIFAFFMGWVQTHSTVAKECEKLGSFYVGDKVYECKVHEVREGK